jgi:anti-anti-sigma regulatory factor
VGKLMASNFNIYILKTRENLHLRLTGDFDGSSAYELINKISEYGNSFYKIFIDINDLNSIHPFGREVFKKRLGSFKNNLHKITIIDSNGHEIFAD